MDIGKLIGYGVVGFVLYEMFFKHTTPLTTGSSTAGTVQSSNQTSNTTGTGNSQTVSASGYKNALVLNMNALGFNSGGFYTQDQWNYFLSTTKVGGQIVPAQYANPGDLHQGHTRTFGIDEYVALLTTPSSGVHGLGRTNHSPLAGYEKLIARGGGWIH